MKTWTQNSRPAVNNQSRQCQRSDFFAVRRLTFSSRIASIVLECLNSGADGSTLYSGLSYIALKRGSLISTCNTYATNTFNDVNYRIHNKCQYNNRCHTEIHSFIDNDDHLMFIHKENEPATLSNTINYKNISAIICCYLV